MSSNGDSEVQLCILLARCSRSLRLILAINNEYLRTHQEAAGLFSEVLCVYCEVRTEFLYC